MADDENTTSDSAPPGWPFNEQPPAIPPAQSPPSFQPPSFEPPSLPAQQSPPSAFEPPSLPAQQPPPPGAQPPPPYVAPTPSPGYNSPGQPPPPTAAWTPGVPQKSSRKSVFATLAIVVGALALGIGACTIWFVGAVKAPVDESNRFLALVDRADYISASALVPASCSGGELSPERLAIVFDQQPIEYNLSSSSITNNDATVTGSFSSTAVSGNRIELFLRDQDGGWKVCGFRFP